MSTFRRLAFATTVSFSLLVLVAGCGDSDDDKTVSPIDQCNEVAKTECARIFACTTPLERELAGLPADLTELGCILGLAGAGQLNCNMATADKICPGAQSYTATQAQACVAEANRAGCDTIKTNYPNVTPYAPSCAQCVPAF